MSASPPEIALLSAELGAALLRALESGALTLPRAWRCTGVTARRFGRWTVHVELERDAGPRETLGLLVAPTDPGEPAYRRTSALDLVYFSQDVPDPMQHLIYARDRATIDRFFAWLGAWRP
jgi:hypothetical protein